MTSQKTPLGQPDPAGPLAVATPTTRRLADASLSVNTRRAYLGALARLDAWRGAAPVDDASLAVYLGELFEAGRAPATAAPAVRAGTGGGGENRGEPVRARAVLRCAPVLRVTPQASCGSEARYGGAARTARPPEA